MPLTYLSEALPVEGRALALRIDFNSSLIDSLKYLLEVCQPVISPNIFQTASEKINSVDRNLKVSGLTGGLHADLLSAIEKEDIEKANEAVKAISLADLHIEEEIKYISFSNLNDYYSPIVQNIFSQEYNHPITFHSLFSEKYEKVKESLERGYKIYKDVVPDFHLEFQEMVSEILVLNAEGLKQGSSSDLFGMLYKCYLYKWEKISDVFEFLTHEQSHLYVHLLNRNDPIILNPTEKYESPLRKEERPLMGIYHATFVLARICYVLNKALSAKIIPESEKQYCEEMITHYTKRFQLGYEILKKHAQMTPLAEALITSARKLV